VAAALETQGIPVCNEMAERRAVHIARSAAFSSNGESWRGEETRDHRIGLMLRSRTPFATQRPVTGICVRPGGMGDRNTLLAALLIELDRRWIALRFAGFSRSAQPG